jgi:hypothetical protein
LAVLYRARVPQQPSLARALLREPALPGLRTDRAAAVGQVCAAVGERARAEAPARAYRVLARSLHPDKLVHAAAAARRALEGGGSSGGAAGGGGGGGSSAAAAVFESQALHALGTAAFSALQGAYAAVEAAAKLPPATLRMRMQACADAMSRPRGR